MTSCSMRRSWCLLVALGAVLATVGCGCFGEFVIRDLHVVPGLPDEGLRIKANNCNGGVLEVANNSGSEVVGWRTAGHAPHMRFIHSDGLHLWIPVGQWMKDEATPINGNGVEPAHEVEPVDDDAEEDPALALALEIAAAGALVDVGDKAA